MGSRRKVIAYVISDIDKALSFEWLAEQLSMKVPLSFILIGKPKSQFTNFLRTHSIDYYEIGSDHGRIRKWVEIIKIMYRLKPAIVHTHLWQANLLGLSAAWLLRVPRRVFTRHHGTIHYREFPKGRKWDKLCNALATDIIAISKNVEEILVKWDGANPNKVKLIHHGFDFEYFLKVDEQRVQALRRKYELENEEGPVIGVISRYMEWKGIQYVIPAFEKLRKDYPNARLILANAKGEYKPVLKHMLASLPSGSFTEISFEADLAALYRLFDVYVHVPIDPQVEAFGQTYVESLLCKVPCIFTLSGIAREFIHPDQNALVVDFKNPAEIYNGLVKILSDKTFRDRISENGIKSVEQFRLDTHILALLKLYNIQYS